MQLLMLLVFRNRRRLMRMRLLLRLLLRMALLLLLLTIVIGASSRGIVSSADAKVLHLNLRLDLWQLGRRSGGGLHLNGHLTRRSRYRDEDRRPHQQQ